jgi:hypothetical protein
MKAIRFTVTFSEYVITPVILANGSCCRVYMRLSHGQRSDQLLANQGTGGDATWNVLAGCVHVH